MHSPLLTDTGPRICSCGFFRNTSSHAKRASSTVFLASADVASFLSASTNHCVYLWSGPTLPQILCHQPDREFLMVRHVTLFPNISFFTLTTK